MARETWIVTNRTNKQVSIGDLISVPVIVPKGTVDLLRYHTYNQIEQSKDLSTLIRMKWLAVAKRKTETAPVVDRPEMDEMTAADDAVRLEVLAKIGDIALVVTVTSDYTATTDDDVILVDATSGSVTITLPSAVGISGEVYHVKKIDSTNNTVIIESEGSSTIDGETSEFIMVQWTSLQIVSNGTNWFIV